MQDTGYPEPTVITIDEQTDFSKMGQVAFNATQKVRRQAIGIKEFNSEIEFLEWQKAEPREIFEITPTSAYNGSTNKSVIFVTYAAGIIE